MQRGGDASDHEVEGIFVGGAGDVGEDEAGIGDILEVVD